MLMPLLNDKVLKLGAVKAACEAVLLENLRHNSEEQIAGVSPDSQLAADGTVDTDMLSQLET